MFSRPISDDCFICTIRIVHLMHGESELRNFKTFDYNDF